MTLLVDRICAPKSKLGSYLHASKLYQIPAIALHQVYRAIDVISDGKEIIEKHLLESQKRLYKSQISAVFYDVTTFYFESKTADGLKNFGFSKDCKFNDVQVVAGFILDESGAVLGYELFEGNTFEGKTLASTLSRLKSDYQITKVILVADRGLNSVENIAAIHDAGMDYVVGSRLKSFNSEKKNFILNSKNFDTVITDPESKEEKIKYKKLIHTRTHYDPTTKKERAFKEYVSIIWSAKRAKKDKADREKLVLKACAILNNPQLLKNKTGAKKYIKKISKDEKFLLDQNKINNDKVWDGLYGIATSNADLTSEEISSCYHSLWKIEALIRSSKSFLEALPVFHWTPKRIKGHFNLCFIALVVQRALEKILKENNYPLSENKIRKALNSMQYSEVEANAQTTCLLANQTEDSKNILNCLDIKIPPALVSKKAFETQYKVL